MSRRSAFHLVVTAVLLSLPVASRALDVPIAATQLTLATSAAGTHLVFASRDGAFPFPPIGSSDAPTAAGLSLELFTATTAPALLTLPAVVGKPGWRAIDAALDSYVYTTAPALGPAAQRSVQLRQGTLFRLRAAAVDLALTAPLETVAVRVTTGTLRSCAVFSGAAVKRDRPGRFLGRNASAPPLADCSDASLATALGASCAIGSDWPTCGGTCQAGGTCVADVFGGCRCVFASEPCGDTYPICGGECPAGEECRQIGPSPFGSCTCAPIGTTPCGAGPYPQCADFCAGTDTCAPGITSILGQTLQTCACAAGPCGSPGFGTCPSGYACALVPGAPPNYFCVPIP
jgi:hypothetical protein